ncbi:MAG: MFS family permease [Candidatus Poriferisodalaceae bacterium]
MPRTILVTFLGAHVVNDFYATIIPAFLPALSDDFDLDYTELGFLALTFSLLSGVLQPVAGHLADQRGKRRFIASFGFAMGAVGFLAMAASPSFWIIVAVSLLCGLGASTYHPQATAFLVQAFPGERGRILGVHGRAGSVGHLLAPAVVVFATAWIGWRWAMVAIALPLLITSVLVRTRLDETEPNPTTRLWDAFTPRLLKVAVAFGLVGIVLQSFITFSVQMLVDEGWSNTSAGSVLTALLIVGVFSQPVGGRLFDQFGGRVVYAGAVVGTGLSVLLFVFTSGALSLLAIGGIAFFGFAMFPVGLALASQMASDGQTGAAVGLMFGVSSLMSSLFKPVMGAVAEAVGDIRSALVWTLVVVVLAIPMSLIFDKGHVTASERV